ncbi:polysaccharide lyase family 7 protein [Flammeovirga agarivorans]|uniref:Polysaccharide lyase family 7 protein n=1 Tax=Flammeovirga agarivorans TaxID=2726742 RepID=A0A7X8XYQ0_9BACT|nr:polysaccharide lyase family 7 protein [Flammeovirga agarivorans]NLR94411.1 polysaccharide lyase family 7 protein [Flammeovirga agarivorans]
MKSTIHFFSFICLFLLFNCAVDDSELEIPPLPEKEETETPEPEVEDEDTTVIDLELLQIIDQGLEMQDFPDWEKVGTISNTEESNGGNNAAKVSSEGDQLSQRIKVNTNVTYEVSAYVKGGINLFVNQDNSLLEDTTVVFDDYEELKLVFTSTEEYITIGAKFYEQEGRIDDFSIAIYSGDSSPIVDQKPTDVIPSLVDWKVTLPVDEDGNDNSAIDHVDNRYNDPLEINDDDLIGYEYRPYFFAENNEVIFRGHCAGTTTKGSKYPRSELRQRVGGGNNYWSVHDEQHLKTKLRVTHLPVVKPEVSMVQIHGPEDEPLRVQYSTGSNGLHIIWNEDNREQTEIDYELGEVLEIEVIVNHGDITCKIKNLDNGQSYEKTWTSIDQTGYFKVGCYTQSSIFLSQFKSEYDESEPLDAYAEVAVQSIELKETY